MLNIDTARLIQTKALPLEIDNSNLQYGLQYRMERLDYRYNPRRGWSLLATASAGRKKIRRNNTIERLRIETDSLFRFSSLYDSLETNSGIVELDIAIEKYWPLAKRHVLVNAIKGAAIFSNELFVNDLNRIGGSRKLRGFDEEAIPASLYTILTLEYRFLLGQNSYFYSFADWAYLENISKNSRVFDRPFGFGAGMTFETKAGIFGLSYALGKQLTNPLDPRTAKIHFGYVNYF